MEDKETVIEENEMLKRHIRTQDTDLHTGAQKNGEQAQIIFEEMMVEALKINYFIVILITIGQPACMQEQSI